MIKADRFAPDAGFLVVAFGLAAITGATVMHVKTPFDPLFDREGQAFGIDADLLRAIARAENAAFNPRAVSPPNRNGTRDYGLMQINEATAKTFGVSLADLIEPELNVHTGARLLDAIRRELGSKFNPFTWIAAYNAGSPTILKAGIINPDYVARVMYHWQLYAIGGLFR